MRTTSAFLFIDHLMNKKADVVRIYLTPDATESRVLASGGR